MREYTAKVTVGDLTIEVSGDPAGLVEIVKGLADSLSTRPKAALPPAPDPEPTVVSPPATPERIEPRGTDGSITGTDPRSVFEAKKPSTMLEAAVLAAYYLAEVATGDERSPTIDRTSMEEVFRKAKWKLPSKPAQLLIDAHGVGYLDRVAPGQYSINNVGHNLVTHTMGRASDRS